MELWLRHLVTAVVNCTHPIQIDVDFHTIEKVNMSKISESAHWSVFQVRVYTVYENESWLQISYIQ